MKACTLPQPFASLCFTPRAYRADPAVPDDAWKTIITHRPGPASAFNVPAGTHVAIHAGDLSEVVIAGPFEAWPPDDADRPHPNHPDGRPARLYRNDVSWLGLASWTVLPVNAVIGIATVAACVPIIGFRDADNNVGREVNFGDGWMHPIDDVMDNARYLDMLHSPRLKVDDAPSSRIDVDGAVTVGPRLEVQGVGGPGWCRDVSGEEPFGEFEPGMVAWILEGAERFESAITADAAATDSVWDWDPPAGSVGDQPAFSHSAGGASTRTLGDHS